VHRNKLVGLNHEPLLRANPVTYGIHDPNNRVGSNELKQSFGVRVEYIRTLNEQRRPEKTNNVLGHGGPRGTNLQRK